MFFLAWRLFLFLFLLLLLLPAVAFELMMLLLSALAPNACTAGQFGANDADLAANFCCVQLAAVHQRPSAGSLSARQGPAQQQHPGCSASCKQQEQHQATPAAGASVLQALQRW